MKMQLSSASENKYVQLLILFPSSFLTVDVNPESLRVDMHFLYAHSFASYWSYDLRNKFRTKFNEQLDTSSREATPNIEGSIFKLSWYIDYQ